jgi:hypothetical protein
MENHLLACQPFLKESHEAATLAIEQASFLKINDINVISFFGTPDFHCCFYDYDRLPLNLRFMPKYALNFSYISVHEPIEAIEKTKTISHLSEIDRVSIAFGSILSHSQFTRFSTNQIRNLLYIHTYHSHFIPKG